MNSKWSLKAGEFAGIGVYLHWTFFIIPALAAFSGFAGGGATAAALSVALVLAVFFCIVLHEFGHALTARVFGVGTRDITLYPIGGIARLERIPENPLQEFAIAVAGPAVNVAIAAVLAIVLVATAGFAELAPASFAVASTGVFTFAANLMWINVVLVAFNMLPAFPMDGGRVLRATLAAFMPYERATAIAAGVGQVMAVLLAVAGLFYSWTLLLVAGFVFLAGRAEASQAKMRARMRGIKVGDVMERGVTPLPANAALHEAVDVMSTLPQQEFPVVDNGKLVGMISKQEAYRAVERRDYSLRIADIMRRNFVSLEASESLDVAAPRVAAANQRRLPVLSLGKLVGLLVLDPLGRIVRSPVVRTSAGGGFVDASSWSRVQ